MHDVAGMDLSYGANSSGGSLTGAAAANTGKFLAKRIMLPFALDVYPLSVLFDDAVIVGASYDVCTCVCVCEL